MKGGSSSNTLFKKKNAREKIRGEARCDNPGSLGERGGKVRNCVQSGEFSETVSKTGARTLGVHISGCLAPVRLWAQSLALQRKKLGGQVGLRPAGKSSMSPQGSVFLGSSAPLFVVGVGSGREQSHSHGCFEWVGTQVYLTAKPEPGAPLAPSAAT